MNYRLWRTKPEEHDARAVCFLNGPLVGFWWMDIEYGLREIVRFIPAADQPFDYGPIRGERTHYELYKIQEGMHVYVLGRQAEPEIGNWQLSPDTVAEIKKMFSNASDELDTDETDKYKLGYVHGISAVLSELEIGNVPTLCTGLGEE